VKQLKHFKAASGKTPDDAMAMILSDQDVEDLAAYFSAQTLRPTGETEPSKLKLASASTRRPHRQRRASLRRATARTAGHRGAAFPPLAATCTYAACNCAATSRARGDRPQPDDAQRRGETDGRGDRRGRLVPAGYALNLAGRAESEATMITPSWFEVPARRRAASCCWRRFRFAAAFEPVQGQHYRLLQPAQPPTCARQVEVVEVFWYACGHCYVLEPKLEAWNQKGRPAMRSSCGCQRRGTRC